MAEKPLPRLVAMDLDGTLLDSQKRVPDGFFEMAAALHANGVHVVIASGRQYFNILEKFAPAKDSLVFMADNGGYLDVYGKTILAKPFNAAEIDRILALVDSIPTAEPVLCRADKACCRACPDSVKHDVGLYYARKEFSDECFKEARKDGVIKVAIHDMEDSTKNIWPVMRVLDGNDMCVRISGDIWLDVMPAGVDKGEGIRQLQKHLGISSAECMAFGDFDNDLGMLEACDESYAMANGCDSVKAVCRHIAPSNDEDGVMTVLRSVFTPAARALS